MNHNLTEENISTLAVGGHGYVGADIAAVCKEAGMHGLRNNMTAEGIIFELTKQLLFCSTPVYLLKSTEIGS